VRDRREYVATLALGAAGAGLVLLCARQDWARVVTTPPEPLPATSVRVSGQSLVPLAGALAVAGLAGLAAVIATRRRARRLTGLLLAVSGVVLAAAVSMRVRAADVAAAAHGGAGSVTGSATAGGAGGPPAPGSVAPGLSIAGHVTMTGFPWRPLSVAGALMIVAAGLVVAWRGGRWPAMPARYEPLTARKPAPAGRGAEPADDAGSGLSARAEPGGRDAGPDGRESARRERPGARDPSSGREAPDSAALWEALSAGTDPTDPG
jgi:uncharacterized membrane protein (TIGR02234 family)